MSGRAQIVVGDADAGRRLDAVVADRVSDVSRSLAQSLARAGHVTVNGQVQKPAHRLASGDLVNVEIIRPASISASPEAIPLTVVYEDPDLAVIDKPAGMVVHPAAGHASGTVANALAAYFPATRDVGESDIVTVIHFSDIRS